MTTIPTAADVRAAHREFIETLRVKVEQAIESMMIDDENVEAIRAIDSAVEEYSFRTRDMLVLSWWKTLPSKTPKGA